MKFMMMMHHGGSGEYAMMKWPKEAIERHISFMQTLAKDLTASGELVDAQGLAHPSEAKIVRADAHGAPAVTDGPFPETKEFLVGYWLIDVPTRERAYELAARASTAPGADGRPLNLEIELREVMSAPAT